MKLDYKYIKKMLVLMEEEETHEFNLFKINDNFTENDPAHNIEKFAHHLSIMNQEGLIGSYSIKHQFGLVRVEALGDEPIEYLIGPHIFITSKGHEFLIALNNDTFFKKLSKNAKEFSISTAMEIGKNFILKAGSDLLS